MFDPPAPAILPPGGPGLPARGFFRKDFLALAAVFLLASTAAFTDLGARDLWFEGEEAMFSLAAWEMWNKQEAPTAGRWPQNHPFVPAAAAALFGLAGGPDLYLARIPSALFSLATLALALSAAWRLFGTVAGVFATGALASSFLFSYMARSAAPDMAVNFFQTAAMAALMAGLEKGYTRAHLLWFWAALVFCFHTGGIAAVAAPVAGALFMTLGPGARGQEGSAKIFALPYVALFLAATVPWFSLQPGRMAPEDIVSISAAWAGFRALAIKSLLFFPWIFAVPFSIQWALNSSEEREQTAMRYLLGAVLGAIGGSLISGSVQVLHIHSILAVILGGYIQNCHLDRQAPWKAPFISNLVATLPLAVGVVAVIAPFWAPVIPFANRNFLILFLIMFYISYKMGDTYEESGSTLGVWAGAVVSSFIFIAFANISLYPAMNRSFSHKVFFHQIEVLLGAGLDLRQYKMSSYQAGYYLQSSQSPPLMDERELTALLEKKNNAGQTVYILARARDREVLAKLATPAPAVYPDSYFVPPLRRLENDRYLIFKFAPDRAHEKSHDLAGPPHRRP